MRGEADRTLPGEGLLYQEQRQEVQTTFTDGVSFHPGYLEGMELREAGTVAGTHAAGCPHLGVLGFLPTCSRGSFLIYPCPVAHTVHPSLVPNLEGPVGLSRVAIPFSRGFSQSRDRTEVSCIAGRFLTI